MSGCLWRQYLFREESGVVCGYDVFTCFDLDISRWWYLGLLGAPIPRQNRGIGAIALAYGPPHKALGCLASFSTRPTASSIIIGYLFLFASVSLIKRFSRI